MKKLLSIIFISILLTGCAVPIETNQYSPQNYVKVDGEIRLGNFSYLPAELGYVKVNQIENTALGSFMINEPIVDLVKRATALELRHSGIALDGDKKTLEVKIKKFKMDDLGYSVDWFYTVNYNIIDNKSNRSLLDKEYTSTMRTTKFVTSLAEIGNILNKVVASNFDKFINDYDARKALEKK
ncbi:integrase [Pasteurella sp. PK-2025]|uniref:integrase n=1 Tax=Pasteurella sp. PK-2025 TaxID=3413133 RepID=UPI003C7920B6